MSCTIRMSTRGRITIPKALRDAMGLRGGMVIEWFRTADGVVGRAAPASNDER